MERKNQIWEAGQQYLDSMDEFKKYHPRGAFINGAKWADAHPNTEDIDIVLAYTYKGLGWLAENIEADMGTARERALACTEVLQNLCTDVITANFNERVTTMNRIQTKKSILKEWCEKNMSSHSDWTGTRVETNNTCSTIDEFVDKLWNYLEEESNKMD